MAGRNVAFVQTIPGRCALSVNDAGLPAPKGWAWVRLGDIARLESGHTPSRNHPEYWDGDIAWIGIKDAREHHGGIINDTSQHVTQAGLDNSAARLLPADTVCLSRTASVGYVVIMGRPMATSQDFVNWVCSPAIEPAYLKWILLAEGDEGLRKFGKGTTHTTIYFPEVQAFHACVAPLNEQRRIVAKLDAVFAQTRAAKARLERLPALIEKLKRSILAAAFRGDLTADWRAANPDVEPASELLERIRAGRPIGQRDSQRKQRMAAPSPLPGQHLPAGWAWARLHDVARRITDGTHQPPQFTSSGVPFVFVRNIVSGTINLDTGVFISNETHLALTRRCPIEPGDVLYSAVGSYGIAVLVETTSAFTFQRHIAHVKPEATIDGSYLRWCLNSPHCRTQADSVARGVAQKTVTLGDLADFTIPVPPATEQLAISAAVKRAFHSIDRMADRIALAERQSEALYEATLQRAFRGELVPQDPADEPAEVMLERIRAAKAEEAPVARRPRAAAAPTYAAPPVTLAQAAESGPLFKHALDRQARAAAEPAALDLVVAALQQSDGRLTAAAIAQATGLDPAAIRAPLKELVAAGQVRTHGKARGTTYEWTI